MLYPSCNLNFNKNVICVHKGYIFIMIWFFLSLYFLPSGTLLQISPSTGHLWEIIDKNVTYNNIPTTSSLSQLSLLCLHLLHFVFTLCNFDFKKIHWTTFISLSIYLIV